MTHYTFLYQTSNYHKLKSFFLVILVTAFIAVIALLFSTVWYGWLQRLPYVEFVASSIRQDILNLNLFGLFYAHFIGGLFFIPSPDEAIFYYGLVKGNQVWFALIVAIIGYMLAQILNYILGIKFSKHIVHFISKKKIYKTRRFANKYGAYGVFIFNLIPSPAPLLTFSLGLTNYNFSRMMFWTFLGKTIKYAIIVGLFLLVK